jgi:FxsC-like protein
MNPPERVTPAVGPQGDALYFFLSYARLGPLAYDRAPSSADSRLDLGARSSDPDHEVRTFFDDLRLEVAAHAPARRGRTVGFFDGEISYPYDAKSALADALGRAQVFVPLYSPSYLDMSWTRREQAAFRARMAEQDVDPERHILPLLWTPVPSWVVSHDQQGMLARARDLDLGVPEYADYGVRALCMLQTYAAAYRRVVEGIAERIIEMARRAPVEPSRAPDPDEISDVSAGDPSFILAVLTSSAADDGTDGGGAGWHPYKGRQSLPIADYAARTAERLGFSPSLVALDAVAGASRHNPVVVLVDPTVVVRAGGEARLRSAFESFPPWVHPLIVGDVGEEDGAAPDPLITRVEAVLASALPASSGPDARRVHTVRGPGSLESRLPHVLAMARRAYLKHGPYIGQGPPLSPRPRLTGGDRNMNGWDSDGDE